MTVPLPPGTWVRVARLRHPHVQRTHREAVGVSGTVLPAEVAPDASRRVVKLDHPVTFGYAAPGDVGTFWISDEAIFYPDELEPIGEEER